MGYVLAVGLGGRVGMVVGTSAWVALMVSLAKYAERQGTKPRGMRLRMGLGLGSWVAVYGVTLVVGLTLTPGETAFWVPMALVNAVPLLLAAWWPVRGEQA